MEPSPAPLCDCSSPQLKNCRQEAEQRFGYSLIITLKYALGVSSLGNVAVAPGEAGSGQWGGSRTSPEVSNPVFRWALPPGKGRWEWGKSRWTVLRLDKAQQERVGEEESAKRRAQKREEVSISIDLKA